MFAVARVRLVELDGTLNVTSPPLVPRTSPATVPRLAPMKSSPGRVTRTDAEFGMTEPCGKPLGRGVMPQPEHPLHPVPLHAETTTRSRMKNAGRNDQRSMQPSKSTTTRTQDARDASGLRPHAPPPGTRSSLAEKG